ncbi:ABC transporter substrate-binding protein [Gephyromycinifex aptenodytis]|uniref:ABC transporter substrate-binding protein n=1 Tax=Gephyromycinifex aptenodytis TaxID=2716227 RepID=UPI001446E6EA|nr:ABC transporter substrate-binding protein [Gephyromycinifex aptenodytis]
MTSFHPRPLRMRHLQRPTAGIAAVLAGSLALSACGASGGSSQPDSGASASGSTAAVNITVTDALDREITLDKPISRAVVLNRNTLELVKLLGAFDTVVAYGDKADELNPYLPLDKLTNLGAGKSLNIEALIAAKPDVVFAHPNRNMELEEKLDPLGIKVIRLYNYLPDKLDAEAQKVGELYGKQSRVEEYLEFKHGIEDKTKNALEGLSEADKLRVVALNSGAPKDEFAVYPSKTTDGKPGTGEGMAILNAGGIDPTDLAWDASESSTTVKLGAERILQIDPDAVTVNNSWYGGYEATDDKSFEELTDQLLNNTSTFSRLKAAKNKRIYFFQTNMLGSDKGYIGTAQLAKWLYPDRFTDVDPSAYAKTYFEEWLDTPFQGTYWYSAADSDRG